MYWPFKRKKTPAVEASCVDMVGIMRWWIQQHDRWMTDEGHINKNIFYSVKDNELRPMIGEMLQQLFPGFSVCGHCKHPWGLVDSRAVRVGPGQCCFSICEGCWSQLRGHGREDYIRSLFHDDRVRYWADLTACQLDAALDQAFGDSGGFKIYSEHQPG